MKKGFTLLELIIVIIIIGVLATLGFTQYTKVVERGRIAEARAILGSLRTAQQAYYLERGFYATTLTDLAVDAPTSAATTHYFIYRASNVSATATRCSTGQACKTPLAVAAYTITLNYAGGTWGGTAGYY